MKLVKTTKETEAMLALTDYSSEGFQAQSDTMDKLLNISNTVDLSKTLIGVIVRFNVADGYAYYRVVEDAPISVEHVPFMDNYRVHPATIRGLRRQDIVNMAEGERRFAKLFAKKIA